MNYKLLSLLFGAASAVPCSAEFLPVVTTDQKTVWLIDFETRRAATDAIGDDVIKIWVKTDHRNDRSQRFSTTLSLYQFKCADQEYVVASWTAYNSRGAVVSQFRPPLPEYEYTPVVPSTPVDLVMRYVCGLRFPDE